MLLHDEIYVQKSEEYSGGVSYGKDENNQLFKGVVCFMITGLKSNVPYIVRSVPETNIKGTWLKEEITKVIKQLQEIGFNVRGVVCDNHPSNVSAFREMLLDYGKEDDEIRVWINGQPIYLFYDPVHIIKNVRNNLLERKRFIFPPFVCTDLKDDVKVAYGEISWSLLHGVHDKDSECQANLRAAPKLSKSVLHPGNCKQSVPTALAIFDPSTRAAVLKYYPQAQDAADFLNLFHTWWMISNSKQRYMPNYYLGNAAVLGDGKPKFLRQFAEWLIEWQDERLRNSEKFTLSAQTSIALIRTIKCQAALIEDLLEEGYDYVLTARFQSDPLERRYGQYRQMSGGRFLISVKDVFQSENVCKIKSLVKEGIDIIPSMKDDDRYVDETRQLLIDVEASLPNPDVIQLDAKSREVSDNVAGYIAYKTRPFFEGCCEKNLIQQRDSEDQKPSSSDSHYISLLSRGGLLTPSETLGGAVARAFALLDATSADIIKSRVPSRKAGHAILEKHLDTSGIVCEAHNEKLSRRLLSSVCNCFFDAQRKRSNEAVVVDRVAAFKANKRRKTD